MLSAEQNSHGHQLNKTYLKRIKESSEPLDAFRHTMQMGERQACQVVSSTRAQEAAKHGATCGVKAQHMHAVVSKTVLLQEGLLQHAPGGQNKSPNEDQLHKLHLPWPPDPFSHFCAAASKCCRKCTCPCVCESQLDIPAQQSKATLSCERHTCAVSSSIDYMLCCATSESAVMGNRSMDAKPNTVLLGAL